MLQLTSKLAAHKTSPGKIRNLLQASSVSSGKSREKSSVPINGTEDGQIIKPYNEIPGPISLPVIGTLYKYLLPSREYDLGNAMKSERNRYEKYGVIVKEEIIPGTRKVHLFDPADAEKVLRQEGTYPIRPMLPSVESHRTQRNIPVGVGAGQGEVWAKLRSATQKFLSYQFIKNYIPPLETVSSDFLGAVAREKDQNGELKETLQALYRWAFESVSISTFDRRLGAIPVDGSNTMNKLGKEYVENTLKVLTGLHYAMYLWPIFQHLPNSKYMKEHRQGLDSAWNMCEVEVEKTLKMDENDLGLLAKPEDSILRNILNSGVDKKSAMVFMNDLVLGGVDTTAITANICLYNLARHPEKQRRLQEEIDRHLPLGSTMTPKSLDSLNYLKAVLKESTRLCPPSQGTCRVLEKDITLKGYNIPAGTLIFFGQMITTSRDDIYEDADKFIPERWMRGSEYQPGHPFASIPFGFGRRSCVGRRVAEQEILVLLAKVSQRFNLEYHNEPIDMKTRLVSIPGSPLDITFKERYST